MHFIKPNKLKVQWTGAIGFKCTYNFIIREHQLKIIK